MKSRTRGICMRCSTCWQASRSERPAMRGLSGFGTMSRKLCFMGAVVLAETLGRRGMASRIDASITQSSLTVKPFAWRAMPDRYGYLQFGISGRKRYLGSKLVERRRKDLRSFKAASMNSGFPAAPNSQPLDCARAIAPKLSVTVLAPRSAWQAVERGDRGAEVGQPVRPHRAEGIGRA